MQRRRFLTQGILAVLHDRVPGRVSAAAVIRIPRERWTAETKKADQGHQDGMKEFMQGKKKPKAKSK